ncbi:acyl-phosphate glycerol 3-phosphate acyltransferase [Vibrio breoganii]|uniref:lysophospholipid acyltransferase family protein n=1 Tax=Vibrio breoganii TaxID=553239 RepID=UPI000C818945|nr:lysophospholipid acyltransferase family protein [Vibrio breoganii]PMG39554.1 acyl-phosphate glycerol 3-phosphate acyltransferase [Vibrio breoganii]PMG82082.1 acyl-phosphate glycerol 3-phosphate acyltransferase [Vibrio breoganii]PMK38999.1 acyl-phosphate glycerol 3-phosphate acyltransferase [Vibrio breoganii]PML82613.1 acyl-phosphate glycerol 3-phosphate acyltransferase [Vibrio breoganii]PMM50181.1 acyl-phosphate glycerol 3-phosphate acyltransferase [Vibrio breoganii]
MKHLNSYWRVFATGFCFFIFGLGGLTLSFIVIPLIKLTTKSEKGSQYKVQRTIQQSFDLFCKTMKFMGAIDYKIVGAEKLKQDKECIVVANHPSLIDYVLIASQLPRCDCLVKAKIWSNPFMKHIVKAAGYIPNEAPDDLISLCEERLQQGNVLLIFPEGTRTTPNKQSKLQRGAAQIAVRTKKDLRLIHIQVSPNFLTKEAKWYQVPAKKPFFLVEVQGKVEVEPFIEHAASPNIAARQLQQHLAEAIFPSNQKEVGISGTTTRRN